MSEPLSKRLHLDGTVQEEDNISLVDDEFWSNSEISDSKHHVNSEQIEMNVS